MLLLASIYLIGLVITWWLAIHNLAPETHEGERSFIEKRRPDYDALRRAYAADQHPEYFWGPPFASCPHCGAQNLPQEFAFCGRCGKGLSED